MAPTSPLNSYILDAKLEGHCERVLCLAVTGDGVLLASGGEITKIRNLIHTQLPSGGDGTIIWQLASKKILQNISTFGTRGATTSIIWVRRDDTLDEGFVYGTHNGYLIFYRRNDQAGQSFISSGPC